MLVILPSISVSKSCKNHRALTQTVYGSNLFIVTPARLWGHDGDGKALDAYFKDMFDLEHGVIRSGWRAPFPIVDDLEIQLFSFCLFDIEYERLNGSDGKWFVLCK